LIDWCLTPTLAIFQLYRGVNKFYVNLDHASCRKNMHYMLQVIMVNWQ